MPIPGDDIAAGTGVSNLLADYAACIDADALERWPDFFTENCLYRITSAFNYARDLPVGIIHADSRRMLEDRVAALRKANIYEKQGYRHIVSVPRIVKRDGDTVEAEAGFLVVRIMHDGALDLFATGRYVDRVDFSSERPRFAQKVVVLDSEKVDTLLAIPL
ncbi:MAG: aromatic-ring-hydroxylating dioxygenase subunit beta [Alphaproteobacteria bacterium]